MADEMVSFDDPKPGDVNGLVVGISYTDTSGKSSRRRITIRSVKPPKVHAYCWTRKQYRSFLMTGISDVVDRDGQVLSAEEFFGWLGYSVPVKDKILRRVLPVETAATRPASIQKRPDTPFQKHSTGPDISPEQNKTARVAQPVEDSHPWEATSSPLAQDAPTEDIRVQANNKGCLLAIAAVLSSVTLTVFGLSEILIFLSLAFLVLAVAAAFKPNLYPFHTKMRRANAFAAYFLVALTFFGGFVISLPKAEKQAVSSPKVTAKSVPRQADPREDRVLSYGDSAGFISGLRLLIPKLTEESKTESNQVETLAFSSIPNRTQVTIETAPGLGFGSALLSFSMVRPMTDKPSAYDGGLKATLEQILMTAASNWPMADQKAFIAACQPVLSGPECDRTIKSVRVTITRFGADLFRMVVKRENAAAGG